ELDKAVDERRAERLLAAAGEDLEILEMVVDVVDYSGEAGIGERVHAGFLLFDWNLTEFAERRRQTLDEAVGRGHDDGCVQLGFVRIADVYRTFARLGAIGDGPQGCAVVAFLEKLGARRLDE